MTMPPEAIPLVGQLHTPRWERDGRRPVFPGSRLRNDLRSIGTHELNWQISNALRIRAAPAGRALASPDPPRERRRGGPGRATTLWRPRETRRRVPHPVRQVSPRTSELWSRSCGSSSSARYHCQPMELLVAQPDPGSPRECQKPVAIGCSLAVLARNVDPRKCRM